MPLTEKVIKQVVEVEAENESAVIESFRKSNEGASDEAIEVVKSAYRLISAHAETLPEGALEAFVKSFDGTAAAAIATLSEVEKGKHKWIAQQLGLTEEQLKAAIEQAKAPKEEEEEKTKAKKSILKSDGTVDDEAVASLPEGIRDEMVALAKERHENAKRTVELEKSLAAEKDARVMREYVEKAAVYKSIGAEPEKFAPVLKAIDAMPEDIAKTLKDLLGSVTALVEKNGVILTEIGKAQGASDAETPIEQLHEVAKEIQAKEPSLTSEQAFRRACEIRKDLKAAHFTPRR